MEKRRDGHRVLMRKHEEKRPFGRPWCRCNDNIKIGIKEL
jgi:hypothetical protein